MSQQDFAKIVKASDGRQVLFYVEPDGDNYSLHQVVSHDGFQADLKVGFTFKDADQNEHLAYLALDKAGQEQADFVIKAVQEFMGATS